VEKSAARDALAGAQKTFQKSHPDADANAHLFERSKPRTAVGSGAAMSEAPLPRIRVTSARALRPRRAAGSPQVAGSRVARCAGLGRGNRGGAAVRDAGKRIPEAGPARILDALAFAYDNQERLDGKSRGAGAVRRKQGPDIGARPLAQMTFPFEALPPPRRKSPGSTRKREHRWNAPIRPRISVPRRRRADVSSPGTYRGQEASDRLGFTAFLLLVH